MVLEGEPRTGRRGTCSEAIRALELAFGLLLPPRNLTILYLSFFSEWSLRFLYLFTE